MQRLPGGRPLGAIALVFVCAALSAYAGPGAPQDDPALDRVFDAYAAGDAGIVARSFSRPEQFRALRLNTRDALTAWLRVWQPRKAVFLLELAAAAADVSPLHIFPIVTAGQKYVAARPRAPGASESEDAFERLWHRTAIGLLQRHGLVAFEERYLAAVQPRLAPPAGAALADARLLLAYGIAQEQRCWNERPELHRAGAVADDVTRATGTPVESRAGLPKSALTDEREQRQACLSEARTRFDAVPDTADAGAEARVRSAWIRFQLDDVAGAAQTIDGVVPGDDRELAYWAGLIGGRIKTALGRHAEAERAYRAALTAWPEGQSAGTGLALTLFAMNKVADASAVALGVRSRGPNVRDPWWNYLNGDQRFTSEWIATLRAAHP